MAKFSFSSATPLQMGGVRKTIDDAFDELCAAAPETATALVAMSDGRVLQHRLRPHHRSPDRIAAIVCSLLAVSETASKELAAGQCYQVMVATDTQNLFAVRIGASDSPFVLAVAFDATMLVGSSHYRVHACARRIALGLEDILGADRT